MMKLRNMLGLAALTVAGLGFVACGGGDDEGTQGGAGGEAPTADGNAEAIADLEAEIAALKELLAAAAEEDIPALQEALTEAREQLNQCQNGGECTGYSEVTESLTVLTDAYCEWIFGCCSEPEAKATVGVAASTEDGCKATYRSFLERGNASLSRLPATFFGESDELGNVAEQVQLGRIAIDQDALEACAATYAEALCDNETPEPVEAECGAVAENPCDLIVVGLREEGETCNDQYDWGECAEGLSCYTDDIDIDGVCLRDAAEGDLCQGANDCVNAEGDLYCDKTDGACKIRPTEGETCAFEDPTLVFSTDTSRGIPCQGGFYCSPESLTCVSTCEAQAVGEKCLTKGTDYCNVDGTGYCDTDADETVEDFDNVGKCAAFLAPGAEILGDTDFDGNDCPDEGNTYTTIDGVFCDLAAGAECDLGSWCQSGTCYEDECLAECSFDSECAGNEVCENNRCYPKVGLNTDCTFDSQCPSSQFCDGGSCVDDQEDGDGCSNDEQCADGTYCDTLGSGQCVLEAGRAAGEECTDWYQCASKRCNLSSGLCTAPAGLDEEGDDCILPASETTNISVDPCQDGLFCKRTNPQDDDDLNGVCTAQIPTGELCDRTVSNEVGQCEGNASCFQNSTLQQYLCPVPLTDNSETLACVLDEHSQNTW